MTSRGIFSRRMICRSLIKARWLVSFPLLARKLCTSPQADMGRFSGKVAIVTASTEGIGFACAQKLGREGAHVLISSRKQQKVDQALEMLQSEGLSVKGMVCHVANPEHRKRLVETAVKEFGGIDILVSNAAANPHFGDMLSITEAQWDKMFDTNVKASFMIAKDCVPSMRERGGGSIVFVTSIAGYQPFPLIAPYSVTKTALLGLTSALSGALSPENIRVNGVAPGVIKTNFSEALWKGREAPEMPGQHIPMGRFGTSEEVAGTVAFLVSPDASYITGETIVIAGGMQSHL